MWSGGGARVIALQELGEALGESAQTTSEKEDVVSPSINESVGYVA